jgi:hypothetical protein
MWYIVILAMSTLMWAAAAALMFSIFSYEDDFETLLQKRRVKFGRIRGSVDTVHELTIACAVMSLLEFLFCLYQWFTIIRLNTRNFTPEEIREGYEKIKKDLEPKKKQPAPA